MIEFIDNPLEQTTAATDAVLAMLCLGCAASIQSFRNNDPFKANLWSGALLALAVASLLGAVAHGFKMAAATNRLIWQPLNLALGLTIALFTTGAVYNGWGAVIARRVLPGMVTGGLLFFAATQFIAGSFFLFIPYAAAGLFFALGVYVWLAARQGRPGALWMVLGILTAMIAAAVQASRGVSLTLLWQFDHRGIFHVIQMVSVLLITAGVRRELLAAKTKQAGHSTGAK